VLIIIIIIYTSISSSDKHDLGGLDRVVTTELEVESVGLSVVQWILV